SRVEGVASPIHVSFVPEGATELVASIRPVRFEATRQRRLLDRECGVTATACESRGLDVKIRLGLPEQYCLFIPMCRVGYIAHDFEGKRQLLRTRGQLGFEGKCPLEDIPRAQPVGPLDPHDPEHLEGAAVVGIHRYTLLSDLFRRLPLPGVGVQLHQRRPRVEATGYCTTPTLEGVKQAGALASCTMGLGESTPSCRAVWIHLNRVLETRDRGDAVIRPNVRVCRKLERVDV